MRRALQGSPRNVPTAARMKQGYRGSRDQLRYSVVMGTSAPIGEEELRVKVDLVVGL